MLRARTVNGATGVFLDLGSTQIYSGNKAALVNILRKQGNPPNFGGSEYGNLENTFGIIRPFRPAQTQINLRISMSVDDITFTQTVLYGGKMSPDTTLRFRVTSHNFA